MKNKIEDLLQKYLDGKETKEDFQELMEHIDAGAADNIVRDKFSEELAQRIDSGAKPTDLEKIRLRKIFGQIKPKLHIPHDEYIHAANRPPVRYSIKKGGNISVLKRMVAVAALMLITLIGAWLYVTNQVAVPVSNEDISHSYTGAQQITLPDESVVLLNEGSSLTHRDDFGESHREVWLEGEGFFEVRNESSSPFMVRTGDIITTVLGTSFNIKAAAGDEEVTITVSRGVVEVGDVEQVYGRIVADEQLAVNKITRKFEKSGNGTESALAWKNRFIILNDIALVDATKIIGDRFGVRISITNENLRQVKISATFLQEEGLEHIIQSISLITRSSYSINGNHIEITGGLDMK